VATPVPLSLETCGHQLLFIMLTARSSLDFEPVPRGAVL